MVLPVPRGKEPPYHLHTCPGGGWWRRSPALARPGPCNGNGTAQSIMALAASCVYRCVTQRGLRAQLLPGHPPP